jgi:DNA mismatch repair protein MutS2
MKTDIFLNRYPSIDLHGFDRDSARVSVNDFVDENVFLKNEMIVIIHGIGTGIVKKEVHEALRVNKNVLEYKTDNFNSGCTVVKLKIV